MIGRGFRPNPHFAAEMAASPAFRAAIHAHADRVRDEAERIGDQLKAPWIPRKGESRTFIVAQQDGETAVINTDYLGHLMEFGWVRSGPLAPLRRAARAAGLDLK